MTMPAPEQTSGRPGMGPGLALLGLVGLLAAEFLALWMLSRGRHVAIQLL